MRVGFGWRGASLQSRTLSTAKYSGRYMELGHVTGRCKTRGHHNCPKDQNLTNRNEKQLLLITKINF